MEEEIIRLGTDQRLVGILSVPAAETKPGSPAVVMLNAGIVHRVGPNRMHVRLARQLAENGHTVLRFDLSGIGDSEPDHDAGSLRESMLSDVRTAMDFLQSRGFDRFILFGLCSGAHLAAACAGVDLRVVGGILIDPDVPPTFKSVAIKVRSQLLRPNTWLGLLSRKMSPLKYIRDAATEQPATDASGVNKQQAASETLQKVVSRGTQLFVMFTGGHRWYTYRDHFLDAFPSVEFGDQLRLEHIVDTDHIFSLEEAQQRLVTSVLDWTRDTDFPVPAGSVEARTCAG